MNPTVSAPEGTRTRTRREVLGGALAGATTVGLAGIGATACSSAGKAAVPSVAQTAAATTAASTAGSPGATTAPSSSPAPKVSRGRTKIIVLGSQGGQQITQLTGANVRCGTSVLIEVDGEVTVLDCGCGGVHRLAEAGYDANQVRNVLITHCHADHVADLGSIASFAWSSGRNGDNRARRLDIYGPTGITDYEVGLKRSLKGSIADQEGPLAQRPKFDDFAVWHQFEPPATATTVLKTPQLEVQAVRVHHGSVPAVGYRVKTPDLDVAFSGDRGAEGDDFVAFARGADVLFHEVIARSLVVTSLQKQNAAPTFIEHLVNDHTDVALLGQIATDAGVPTLVMYHLIPGNPAITDKNWADQVRPHFKGEIIVARDLLVV
jgi:ribonuclease BN (tRNA processing enzyme)